MNKYQTGSYHLHLFDKFGSLYETHYCENLTESKKIGEVAIASPPCASYAITRVLANSIDTAYPWDVPADYVPPDGVGD